MPDKIWCQNSKCANKQNQNQVRGVKGSKYYQSNKASRWYVYWCSRGCRDEWWKEHKDTCMRAVGFRLKPVKLTPESSWKKSCKWNRTNDSYRGRYDHYLENILLGEKIPITEVQYDSISWENNSKQSTTLANQLRSQAKLQEGIDYEVDNINDYIKRVKQSA